ncbi:glycosyltransferase [Gaoshiqia sp. Z1-71]|uniref:glycosyltransferase n=1 Tax=Gaoshiqia hydrogeniformans TaxID=3290090 RepID=UPI003BF7D0DF
MKGEDSNKVMQSFWFGQNLTKLEQLSILSYLANGHEFHLYCYDKIEGVPIGTVVKDANEIIEKRYLFVDPQGSVAPFADWFRYNLLYKKGGWWVDLDSVCLKPFDFNENQCFSSEKSPVPNDHSIINNTYIKAAKGDDFILDCIKYIKIRGVNGLRWAEFGPYLLSKVLSNYDVRSLVKAPEIFCPYNWVNISDLIAKPSLDSIEEQTYAIHFWNEIWRRGNLNKNATYHPESIFEQLKRRYLK